MKKSLWRQINEGIHDMCYIWWMEMKNVFKDEGVLIFFIITPLFYPLIYSWIYTNEVVHEVPVAIVDQSHTRLSREFIQRFDASPQVRAAYYCNNLQEARALVGHQAVRGVVYIPSEFDRKVQRGEQTHVSVYCDMALLLTYKAIYQTAVLVSLEMNKNIQKPRTFSFTERDCEINTEPMLVEEVAIFNTTGGYGNAVLPAVLILIIQQTLLLGIGLSAGTARERNRHRELIPVSKHYNGIFRIVLGKSMCYFMIYAVMGTYMTLCVPRFFGFTSMLHYSDLFGLMLPYVLACIFFGMMISCVVRYRENVMLLVVFTSVPMLFLTGVSWPKSCIPGYWQGISWLLPSTFGIRGFLALNSMGGRLHDIRPEYQALWIQALAYFFVTCLVYRYQIIHARRNYIEERKAKHRSIPSAPSA